MKKKYIIVLIIIFLLVICLISLSVLFMENKRKSEELEAIEIFEKNADIRVSIRTSVDNIDDIKNKLKSMEYVKSVELVSKEDELQNLKDKFSSNVSNTINNLGNILPNSFIIKLEINDIEDFKKVKILVNNLGQIDGIDNVTSSGCNEIIEVYEKTGIKGLREYDKVLTIMNEQGINAINDYLKKHKETRELLKEFIHF